ncbi:nucleoside deaminase [Flagellimonas flava]|uniref:tRNA(Arg) A34 adenosine deaminase TadA n=1 Tax=Flagellimonas flava TaxID=570519 RepID=A0A1M5M2I1_9FLAO|nr:nucleoside deaminase [Allomuricauda flava]SHG71507.1 tRNA(Arg) A34 adenosine deaminase TadA [Allomuricauda flava]
MENAHQFMARCQQLANQAAAKGNSAVGSLISVDNEVIAEAEEAGFTKQDVSCHAEMEVIREARKTLGKDMSKAILYTTKEPCVMCSYAIRFHKIGTVVFKEKSAELGGLSSAYNLLTSDNVPKSWGSPVQCIQLEQEE